MSNLAEQYEPFYLPAEESYNYELPPTGPHPAVLYRIIDLGSQKVDYKGETKLLRKVLLSWELHCDERMRDGNLFTVHQRYTWSMNEKANLRQMLQQWRGVDFSDGEAEKFNIVTLLGKPCMLTITHTTKNDKTYANINGVSRLYKGMEAPQPVNQPYCLQLSDRGFVADAYDALSDNLKKAIQDSPEYCKLSVVQQGGTAHVSNDTGIIYPGQPSTQPPADVDLDDDFPY